jgi:K+ transporter
MSTSTRVEDAFPPYGFGKRQQLRLSKRQLAIMAFSNLGIIYSDIGTSPLYVLSTIWSTSAPPPSEQDIIGGISAIVWAFTLLPLVKYVSSISSAPHATAKKLTDSIFRSVSL